MTDLIVFIRWLFLPRNDRAAWWSFYSAYLQTAHWRNFTNLRRKSWLARLMGWNKCAKCGSRHDLQTHHPKGAYAFIWREWLHVFGFQTLCDTCHQRVTRDSRNRV